MTKPSYDPKDPRDIHFPGAKSCTYFFKRETWWPQDKPLQSQQGKSCCVLILCHLLVTERGVRGYKEWNHIGKKRNKCGYQETSPSERLWNSLCSTLVESHSLGLFSRSLDELLENVFEDKPALAGERAGWSKWPSLLPALVIQAQCPSMKAEPCCLNHSSPGQTHCPSYRASPSSTHTGGNAVPVILPCVRSCCTSWPFH